MSASHLSYLDLPRGEGLSFWLMRLDLNWTFHKIGEQTVITQAPSAFIAGQKAFQAISSGNESQTDWSLMVRSSAFYQVRRKDNKEAEAPPLKDTPCVYRCLGPAPLSVGWWKDWAAEAFICRLWLINVPNKAHYWVHTMWHSGFTFLPNGRSRSISVLLPLPSALARVLMRTFVMLKRKSIPRPCRRPRDQDPSGSIFVSCGLTRPAFFIFSSVCSKCSSFFIGTVDTKYFKKMICNCMA